MLDRLVSHNDVLETALQASAVKNDVIMNNIANVDTPGYKKKTVVFDTLLQDALSDARFTGEVELNKVRPRIQAMHQSFSYRIDENNVDMELEMVDLYSNSLKYDTMAGSVINNYKRLSLVLKMK